MTREEAIKEMQSYADSSWGGLNDAFEMSIAALREQEARSKGCEFCREASFTEKPFDVKTQRGHTVSVQFNCCPVCGRKLEVEG